MPPNQPNSRLKPISVLCHGSIELHSQTNANHFSETGSSLAKNQDAVTARDFFDLLSASASFNTLSTSFFLRAFSLHLSLSSVDTEELISAKLALMLLRPVPGVDLVLLPNFESGVWYTLPAALAGVLTSTDELIFPPAFCGVPLGSTEV
jgi:hypothetical protein